MVEIKRGRRKNGTGTVTVHKEGRVIAKLPESVKSKLGYGIKTFKIDGKVTEEKACKDAEKWLDEQIRIAEKEKALNSSKMIVDEFFEKWHTTCNKPPYMKEGTANTIKSIYAKHIVPKIGQFQIGSIASDELQELISEMSETYRPSTVEKIVTLLKQIFGKAYSDKIISINPAANLKKGKDEYFQNKTKEVLIYDDEDIVKLYKVINKVVKNGRFLYRYGYVYILILVTGLRLGEMLALTWDDIDFENRTLSVNKAINKIKQDGRTIEVIGTTKTPNANRKVMLCDEAIHALKKLKESNKAYGVAESNFVVTGDVGQQAMERTVQKTFERILKRAGLLLSKEEKQENIRFIHSLRHTYASKLIASGASVFEVSRALGHKSIRVTLDVYGKMLEKQELKLLGIKNEVFNFGHNLNV